MTAIIVLSWPAKAQTLSESARSGLLPGQSVGTLKIVIDKGGRTDLGKPVKPYILGFFVPGRTDIQVQFRELSKILNKKEYRNFDFHAVTRGKDAEEKKNARQFLKNAKIDATLIFDSETEIAKRFGTLKFPSFYIVDKTGTVRSIAIQSISQMIRKRSFEDFLKLTLKGDPIPFVDMIPYEDISKDTLAMIGKKTVDFNLPDLNRKNHALSMQKGKNVILVYFSPNCPHCMIEFPKIQDFYINNRTRYNFEVLAVTRSGGKEGEKKIKGIIDKHMPTFPVLLDEKGTIAADYGVRMVPMVFFINKNGVLADVIMGENEFFPLIYHSIFRDPLRLAN